MIEILKVIAANIGPYEKLEVDLANRGVVLLTGKNGVGKSTIVDIVQLGFYGRSARYFSYKDLLRKGQSEGTIIISFRIGSADYYLERTIQLDRQKLKLFKATPEDYQDITGIHLESTQEKLERILKTSWNVFSNIVTVSGEPILFSETDGYQKSFMERMLGFEVYSEAQDLAKSYRRAVEEEMSKLRLDISTLSNKQQTIKVQIETLGQKDVAVKKGKLEDAKIQLQGMDADIAGIEGEILNLDTMIKSLDKEQDSFVDGYRDRASKIEEASEAKESIFRETVKISNELDKLAMVTGQSVCPTCLQNVSKEKTEAAVSRVSFLEAEIGKLYDKLDVVTKVHKALLDEYMNVTAKKEKIEKEITKLEATKHSLLAERGSKGRRRGAIEARIEEIEKEAGAEVRPLQNSLSEIEIIISDKAKALQENQKTLDVMEFCIEAFGDKGIKSLLIEQYLMGISETMNENLEFLTEGRMSAFLAPTKKLKSSEFRDKMTLKVVDRDSSEELLDYQHCSKGQRACVNVAALMAFHDTISKEKNVSWSVLFLDEVLDCLDDDRVKNMSKLLARKSSEFPSIILTTHKNEFKEAFENTWTVSKRDGASRLEET